MDAETWTVDKLAKYRCGSADSDPKFSDKRDWKPVLAWDMPDPPVDATGKPKAPQNLRMWVQSTFAHEIVDELTRLSDERMMTLARKAHRRFDAGIYSWELHRMQLAIERTNPANVVFARYTDENGKEVPVDADGATRQAIHELLEVLPLSDIVSLSQYEPIPLTEWETLTKPLTSITVPQLSLLMGLSGATAAAQLLMFLSLYWFWLNQREIELGSSDACPVGLFGMFGRSFESRVCFRLLLTFPSVAGVLVAYAREPLNILSWCLAVASVVVGVAISRSVERLWSRATPTSALVSLQVA